MKKFIFNLFYFLAIQFILFSGIAHLLLNGIYMRKGDDYEVLTGITKGGIDAEILINGSSRALTHFNSSLIQKRLGLKTYNIASNGTEIFSQVPILDTYIDNNRDPKYLVQIIDMSPSSGVYKVFNPPSLIPFLFSEKLYNAYINIDYFYFFYKYFPLTGFIKYPQNINKGLEGYMSNQNLPEIYGRRLQGFSPRPANKELINMPESWLQLNAKFEINKFTIESLNSIINMCKSRKVQLFLIISPLYMDAFPKSETQITIARHAVEEIARENNIILFDFMDAQNLSDISVYSDPTHLNFKGANIISNNLSDSLAYHFQK